MITFIERNIKKSFFIIIVFFAMSIFISTTTSSIESARRSLIETNKFLSNNAVLFNIKNANEIKTKDFLQLIKNQKNLILERDISDFNLKGKAIYFDNLILGHPDIISGRYFESNDFKTDEPKVVIGKDVAKYVKLIGSDRYLTYNGVDYKVIGVMGDKNNDSIYNSEIIINLNSLIEGSNSIEVFANDWTMDSVDKNDLDIAKENLYNSFEKISSDINLAYIYKEKELNPLNKAFEDRMGLIKIATVIIVILFLNIVSVTAYWMDRQKKEIGIRKTLGATNNKIILRIVVHYLILSIIATTLAIGAQFIIINVKILRSIKAGLYINSIVVTFVIALIIGLITALITARNTLKFEANDIMKGRY